jgi:hypothetical protein
MVHYSPWPKPLSILHSPVTRLPPLCEHSCYNTKASSKLHSVNNPKITPPISTITTSVQRVFFWSAVRAFSFFSLFIFVVLRLTRQILYHLSHAPSPFCFSYFSDRGLLLLPGAVLDCDPSTYTSWVAGMTGVHQYTWLVCQDGGLANFLPRLAWNQDPPNHCLPNCWDSAVSHCTWWVAKALCTYSFTPPCKPDPAWLTWHPSLFPTAYWSGPSSLKQHIRPFVWPPLASSASLHQLLALQFLLWHHQTLIFLHEWWCLFPLSFHAIPSTFTWPSPIPSISYSTPTWLLRTRPNIISSRADSRTFSGHSTFHVLSNFYIEPMGQQKYITVLFISS